MSPALQLLRRNAKRICAVLVLLALYQLAQLPSVSSSERAALADRFRFVATPLPVPPGPPPQTLRPVNPNLAHIVSWISSVGAAVALADIEGTGVANDACFVDTRTNRVIVAPVPGSGDRYAPFALDFSGFHYDSTMAPMGCLPGNFTEGPQTELLVYFWGRTPVVFLRRPDGPSGLGPTSFFPQEIIAGEERWFSNAATQADVDGDGHLDLIIGNYFADGAHILDAHATEGDTMQHSMSRALNGAEPRVLIWTGATRGAHPSVSYRDATNEGVPGDARHGWTLAVGAADLSGKLLPNLYLANDFGPDRPLDNRSTPGHPELGLEPADKPAPSRGIAIADAFGDGRLDFAVANQWGDTFSTGTFRLRRTVSSAYRCACRLRNRMACRRRKAVSTPSHPHGRRSELRPPLRCPMAGAARRRWTAATAIPASARPSFILVWETRRRTRPFRST
jgi:enediyne biosynthesis protein E4